MQKKRILILGEYGAFSRRIIASLSRFPLAECVIGAKKTQRIERMAQKANIAVIPVDAKDVTSLRQSLDDVFAVVNIQGPFLGQDNLVASLCAHLGIHYVDPADSRDHVRNIARLSRKAEKSGSLIVSGAGAVPAVSSALVDTLAGEFDKISEIHTALVRARGDQRALAVMRAILSYSGSRIRIKEKGRWRETYGWTKPEKIDFPAPIGRRRAYLCDMPDLDIFPRHYVAQTVTSRAVLPSRSYNLALYILGWLKRRDVIRDIPKLSVPLIRIGSAILDSEAIRGGMRVLVRGQKGDEEIAHTVFLIARDDNMAAVAAAPCIALIKKWISQDVPFTGAAPCVGMLSWDEIKDELLDYDIVLVRR